MAIPRWHEQPIPFRLHRCRPTEFGTSGGLFVARCACGGVQINHGTWIERNSRKR